MPLDRCDCCKCAMKHERIAPTYFFVCDDCRDEGMRRLGRDFTALAVGIKAEK